MDASSAVTSCTPVNTRPCGCADVRNSASGSVATFASVAVEGGESWVGGAAIDPADNWLAIGSGSGGVGVYHIGSRILTASGQASGAVQHMMFHEGQVRVHASTHDVLQSRCS